MLFVADMIKSAIIKNVSILSISNFLDFKGLIKSRVTSSLNDKEIVFPPYGANQLTDILSDEYTIVEAENGKTAIKIIQEDYNELSLILLDLSMPEVDGYEVLKFLNESDYIKNLPVIIISAETSPEKIKEAYELGATDFISRPFDSFIVHKRISNTILLYNKQKNLVNMVVNQISKNQKDNNLMVAILSQLVEFRNGESGLHVQNIRKITKLLLTKLIQKTDKYKITEDDISMICLASALHIS